MTAEDRRFIRITNWTKYQHYSDRNPPWIKLHRDLLTSEVWTMSGDASKALAVAIMLLAAVHENKIPAKPCYIKRVAYLDTLPDFSPLIENGFIEIIDENLENASALLAHASNLQAYATPETETEKNIYTSNFESFWKDYPRKIGRLAALRAFKAALKKDSFEAVMTGLAKAIFSPDQKFIPHPATWLNQGRWMDEPGKVNGYERMSYRVGGL